MQAQLPPSTLPARPRTRLLTFLGVTLTLQLYDMLTAILDGPYATAIALVIAGGFLAGILFIRRQIKQGAAPNTALMLNGFYVPSARTILLILVALEILWIVMIVNHNALPCSWLDISRRVDGCIASFSHAEPVTTVSVSPDNALFATTQLDGTVQVWSMAEKQILWSKNIGGKLGPTLAFSPTDHLLAAGLEDGTVQLMSPATGAPIRSLTGATDSMLSVAFSPDGRLVAAGSADKTVRVWQVADGGLVNTFTGLHESAGTVAFSPDGTLLAAGEHRAVWVWSMPSGTLYTTFKHASLTESIAFSPDGTLLAVGGWRGTVDVWNVRGREALYTLHAMSERASSVAFSPDGSTIAVGGIAQIVAGEVGLWRVEDGQELQTLRPRSYVYSIAWTPDGKQLLVTSHDAVELWNIK
ncbi:MAG: WD40 repeat domain-containing protein [Chloroflexi bacterium]|nr:WD40 repeat domain-containing protein [Chloroflexota bacterium]